MPSTETVVEFYRRPSRWTIDKPWVLLTQQRIERALAAALRETATALSEAELLDLGTGGGAYLNTLIKLGATPSKCHGIDLVPERIRHARERSPVSDLRVGDVLALPYEDTTFDVVSQFTCFCNLQDDQAAVAAREAMRVLAPGGRLLWFDLADCRPGEVTRPIAEPESLFPQLQPLYRKPLLHPWTEPLNSHLILSELIERLPVRKANLLVVFVKPHDASRL